VTKKQKTKSTFLSLFLHLIYKFKTKGHLATKNDASYIESTSEHVNSKSAIFAITILIKF